MFRKIRVWGRCKGIDGRVGDAPAYQYIPTKMVCPECDYYEEV